MKLSFALLVALLVLAACNSAGVPSPTPTSDIYNPQTSGTNWERSPSAIVFRADVTGGVQDEFLARSDVPFCTVYGDNRVVWTNEVGAFNVEVLYDIVSDEAIRIFADYLILSERIYDYGARADLQIPRAVTPVVEVMQLNVNGQPYTTDAFAGWEYEYYQRILDACRAISQAPVLFEPTESWLSARQVEYNIEMPIILWDAQAAGLSFAAIAAGGERQWVTGNNVRILWNVLRTSPPGIQFVEDELYYQIALEVPNVTRLSPPAPQHNAS